MQLFLFFNPSPKSSQAPRRAGVFSFAKIFNY